MNFSGHDLGTNIEGHALSVFHINYLSHSIKVFTHIRQNVEVEKKWLKFFFFFGEG